MVDLSLLLRVLSNAIPIMLSAYGELLVERSGRVNLGVDGIMALGASISVLVSAITGNTMLGLLSGLATGLAASILYIIPVIVFRVDQVATGLLLVFLAWGLADLIASIGYRVSPSIPIGSLQYNILALITVIIPLILWLLMYKTWIGVEIRAIGYNEILARERGLRVDTIRAIMLLIGGALAGLSGSYMALTLYNGKYFTGITGGWGWLAIGSVILGYWHPVGVAVAAYSIGLILTLRPYLEAMGLGPLSISTPYIMVILSLIIAAYISRSPRFKPPRIL
ncbi:MAG: ABC transporter permease [Acidilobaceae archaeon]